MISTRRIILMIAVFVLFLPLLSLAGTVDLPKTGQTTSYYSEDDGDLQAGVAWPVPRFTDNGDGTVSDTLTGLMWLKDGNCANTIGYDPDGIGDSSMLWQNTLDFVKGINDGTHDISACSSYTSSYSDWRLPNVNELESLLNAEEPNVAVWLNNQAFSNVQSFNGYWSSTTYIHNTNLAWGVGMWNGYVGAYPKSIYKYAWPVRTTTTSPAQLWKTGQTTCYDESGNVIGCTDTGQDGELQAGVAWPDPRFTDNGNGTITDNLTGLMWLQDANCISTQYPGFDNDGTAGDGMVSWQHALDFTVGINDGTYSNCGAGHADWRLPNRKEFHSLTDFSQRNPALPLGHPFTNVQSNYYWSSTTFANYTSYAWHIYMWAGYVGANDKVSDYYIWPVRAGTVQADPVPDVKANGSDGPVVIPQGDNLAVSIALDPGSYLGDNADWWILIFYYNPSTGSWVPIPLTVFQAPLFDLPPTTLLDTTGFPSGIFIFFFGVDMDANGTFDPDQLYSDLVVVIIQ